jgi:hypothetical protein
MKNIVILLIFISIININAYTFISKLKTNIKKNIQKSILYESKVETNNIETFTFPTLFGFFPDMRTVRAYISPVLITLAAISVIGGGIPMPVHARMDSSKQEFLKAVANGESVDKRDKRAMEAQLKTLESRAKELILDEPVVESGAPVGAVRVIDLGGNRGARGLASNGVQGGSLADQLKAYGGPGAVVKEDKSFKNPVKAQPGIGDQLKLYQTLQGQGKQ